MGLGWGRSPRTTGLQAPAARAWTGPAEARHPTPAGCARGRVSGPLGESGYSLATSRALSSGRGTAEHTPGGARRVQSSVSEEHPTWRTSAPESAGPAQGHGERAELGLHPALCPRSSLPLLPPCRLLYASASSPWRARVRAGPHLGPWPTSLYRAPGSCHHGPLPLHWNSPISSAGQAHHHAAWLVPAAPS